MKLAMVAFTTEKSIDINGQGHDGAVGGPGTRGKQAHNGHFCTCDCDSNMRPLPNSSFTATLQAMRHSENGRLKFRLLY